MVDFFCHQRFSIRELWILQYLIFEFVALVMELLMDERGMNYLNFNPTIISALPCECKFLFFWLFFTFLLKINNVSLRCFWWIGLNLIEFLRYSYLNLFSLPFWFCGIFFFLEVKFLLQLSSSTGFVELCLLLRGEKNCSNVFRFEVLYIRFSIINGLHIYWMYMVLSGYWLVLLGKMND